MWNAVTSWTAVLIAAPLLVGIGVSVLSMAPPEYRVARGCFWTAWLVLLGKTAWWLATQRGVDVAARLTFGVVVLLLATAALVLGLRFVRNKQQQAQRELTWLSPAQMSSGELKKVTGDLAVRLRRLQKQLDNGVAASLTLTNREEHDREYDRAHQDVAMEFGPLRSRALALRDELFHRLRHQPRPASEWNVEMSGNLILNTGSLAGVQPLRDVADYLESLAQLLPP